MKHGTKRVTAQVGLLTRSAKASTCDKTELQRPGDSDPSPAATLSRHGRRCRQPVLVQHPPRPPLRVRASQRVPALALPAPGPSCLPTTLATVTSALGKLSNRVLWPKTKKNFHTFLVTLIYDIIGHSMTFSKKNEGMGPSDWVDASAMSANLSQRFRSGLQTTTFVIYKKLYNDLQLMALSDCCKTSVIACMMTDK